MGITIKQPRELNNMRQAGHVVSVLHQRVAPMIQPGITTLDLDLLARDVLVEFGAGSAFLGHQGFPGRVCVSVNEEIVHGIPGRRVLKDGDIISVDFGAIIEGYYGDSAWTYPVGTVSEKAANLLKVTADAATTMSPNALITAWPYSAQAFWSAEPNQLKLIDRLPENVGLLTEIDKGLRTPGLGSC